MVDPDIDKMVDPDIIRVFFGIIANLISIGLFASAVPTFYRAVKNDFVEDVKPEYYLTTLNCLFLVLYGLPFIHPGNILLLPAYGTGLAIHLAYFTTLLLCASRQRMYVGIVFLTGLLVTGLIVGLVIGLGHTIDVRTASVGLFCLLIGISNLIPRICLVLQVTETKSVEGLEGMPFFITLSDTLNGLCWCIYVSIGDDRYDSYLMFTNGLGFLLGLLQLSLYRVYRITTKSGDHEKLAATADKSPAQAEHDKMLALILKHDRIKRAMELAQAELDKIKLDLAEHDKKLAQAENGTVTAAELRMAP